jgi:hypothetical protein
LGRGRRPLRQGVGLDSVIDVAVALDDDWPVAVLASTN